mgnify:CR=1 FL=1
MMTLTQIESFYPETLRPFKKNLLREYLQYKILEIIFASPQGLKMAFLGGTALRIIYEQPRFSEDLDFDNFGLSELEFTDLSHTVRQGLEREGLVVEIKQTMKGAFRCNIKLPGILFAEDLSPLPQEKILIQIDTAPHDFVYEADVKLINKFDVITDVRTTPLDIILAQKIYAIFGRKRAKGRDFFDVLFLFGRTRPNYKYLKQKLEIGNAQILKEKLLEKVNTLDMKALARDVAPFLFRPSESAKVERFGEYVERMEL